ncbi:MAG TPA: ATP-binding cassette domain-containing protein [Vicinamibacterales bacterium]|nr:ATP-binding cassette domain-containing protein [Vicinamibacterales bacterium]
MATGMTLLAVSSLQVARGPRLVVRDVSFGADRGELVALMGASGTGKTTVLRAIAGLEPVAAGAIDIDGLRLSPGGVPQGAMLRELHRRVGMVFQFHHLFAHKTALENVWLAPVHVLGRSRVEAERDARALLAELGVAARADAMPHELSGGEAQRVAIARALAVKPPVLLMDEPTASLDPARRGDLAATLRDLADAGRTILIATHDAEFARACARRVLVMDEGRVSRAGTPADVL